MMFAYIGPESVSALASGVAAVFGALLIGWRWISRPFRRLYRAIFRIKTEEDTETDESVSNEAARERS